MNNNNTNKKEDALRLIISQLINLIDDELWDSIDLEYQDYATDRLNEIEEQVKNI